jgi:hypothetical protein
VFKEYFIEAQEFLRRQGMNPALRQARSVSEADIDVVNQRTDWPMPAQLRGFWTEMGDGFAFVPNDAPDFPLEGWEPNWLSDYATWHTGFSGAIEEEAAGEIASSRPRVDPQLLREEAERRRRWIPFYGFVGGGDVLCLDVEGKVRFYEALNWRARPATWSFVLADSLRDFVEKWSRYSFTEPGCPWTSFCHGLSGVFGWGPSHFPHGVPRGSLGRAATERGHEEEADP